MSKARGLSGKISEQKRPEIILTEEDRKFLEKNNLSNYRVWSKREEKILSDGYQFGKSAKQIAKYLKRSVDSVRNHASTMCLKHRRYVKV